MHKNQKTTDRAPKKLTVDDLKKVIGGVAQIADPTVETEYEDPIDNKALGRVDEA